MSGGQPQSERPAPEAFGVLSGKWEDVRRVAVYQKWLILCLLAQVLLLTAALEPGLHPDLQAFLGLSVLPLGLASLVFVVLLALKVYGVKAGVLLGVCVLIPCFSLFVLLAVNGKAISVLRWNGIRVGLFGAKLSKVRPPAAPLPQQQGADGM